MNSTHYGFAQDPKRLKEFGKNAYGKVMEARKKLRREHGANLVPMIVYSGMSGICSATALSLQLNSRRVKHGMCYVRKASESSHGSMIELGVPGLFRPRSKRGHKFFLVFVDDIISSGTTANRSLYFASSHIKHCTKHDLIQGGIGVLEHNFFPVSVHPPDWLPDTFRDQSFSMFHLNVKRGGCRRWEEEISWR